MRKTEKPAAPPRRFWRMTPEAPRGEVVEVDARPEKTVAPPAPDELRESSWLRSSWDLLNGLEVTETSPGELEEGLFDVPTKAASDPPGFEPARDAGEWIRRFALRLSELDRQREPRALIELARRQWTTHRDLAPEEAAETEYRGPARA